MCAHSTNYITLKCANGATESFYQDRFKMTEYYFLFVVTFTLTWQLENFYNNSIPFINWMKSLLPLQRLRKLSILDYVK